MHCHRLTNTLLVAICASNLLLFGCAGAKPSVTAQASAVTEAPGDVVATVGGEAITRAELDRNVQVVAASQGGRQMSPGQLAEVKKQALDQLVDALLLYQAGQKLEVKDLEKNVEARVADFKSRFKDAQGYAAELERFRMTEEMLRDYTRRDFVIANLVNSKIAAGVKVGEDEIKRYYDDNPEKFLQNEQVRVSHILVGVGAKASDEDKKKAREKAEKLRAEVAGGADFAEAAKANSTCPSAKEGGDLGHFGKGAMVAPFEEAAFALQPKEISAVVETEFGYHILKQTDRIKGQTVSFAVAKEQIRAHLSNLKLQEAVAAFVVQARQDAKIELRLK